MLLLDAITKKLQLVLSGAITVNQLPVVANYVDIASDASTYTPGASDTASNSTTAVDIVAAPAASTIRQVKFLSIQNADTVSAVVTVRLNNNATLRTLWKGTLQVGDTLMYTDGAGFQVIDQSGNIKVVQVRGTNDIIRMPGIAIDGGAALPSTGQKGYLYIPFACTIKAATLVANASGSCVIDVWKAAYNTIPTVANTITASAKPTLSSAQRSQDTTLSGWTTSVAAGDVLGFNLNSVSTITRVSLVLTVWTT